MSIVKSRAEAEHPATSAPQRRRMRGPIQQPRFLPQQLLRFGPAVALVGLWQLVTSLQGSIFFPTPVDIVQRAVGLWFSSPATSLFLTDAFWVDVVPSLVRALTGWLLAAFIGISLGLVAGQWVKAAGFIDPPVNFMRSLPKPAIVPVFLLVFGANDAMRVGLITFGCIWPVLLNTMQGVRSVDPSFRETATAYHIPAWKTFGRVVLPAASPKIFAGMRVSLSLSLILMVLSEWMLAENGLGYFLLDSQRRFQVLDLWAAIFLLGVIGYLLNVVFLIVERRFLRWHHAISLVG